MPIPTAVKYGREASQPPTASKLGGNNRAVINGSTELFSHYALLHTYFAITYSAVIADLGIPTTNQQLKFCALLLFLSLPSEGEARKQAEFCA